MLRALLTTRVSKFATLLRAFCPCAVRPAAAAAALATGEGGDDADDALSLEHLPAALREYWAERGPRVAAVDSKLTRMYTPGRILHLTRTTAATCCGAGWGGLWSCSGTQCLYLGVRDAPCCRSP